VKASEQLYKEIGDDMIEQIITEFYQRAFNDVIIGHFFWGKNHDDLVEKQISFTKAMLGKDSSRYTGKPIKAVHAGLKIRKAHFDRRKVLLAETMDDMQLAKGHKIAWLTLEEKLRKLIQS